MCKVASVYVTCTKIAAACLFQSSVLTHLHTERMVQLWRVRHVKCHPDSKIHVASVGPTWGRQNPGGPHVGHTNFAISGIPFFDEPAHGVNPRTDRQTSYGLWTSYQIRKIVGCSVPGMPGTFSPAPRVSDPDMHHGTCVTHVPWWCRGR